jgi:hypothetical protein
MSLLASLAIIIDDDLRQTIGHGADDLFSSGASRLRMPSEHYL